MAGIASKELQAQKWWPHVHCWRKDVMQTSLPGWVKIIPQWVRVQSKEKSAFTGLEDVATHPSTFKLRTAAPTISTSWFLQEFVRPVTVALTNPGTNALVWSQYWWLFRDVIAISLLSLIFLFTIWKLRLLKRHSINKKMEGKFIIYINLW